MHEKIATPVTIVADEVQLVVLATEDLNAYYSREEGYEFIAVFSDKIARCEWDESGDLRTSAWNGDIEIVPGR